MKYILLLLLYLSLYAQNTLGRIDKFDLPELKIYNIPAKIDTGAKTSSINCSDITYVGNNQVSFLVLDAKNNLLTKNHIKKNISRITKVKSSNGDIQTRYFVNTKIIIYNKVHDIELSLTTRKGMLYPLLIGRDLLMQGFILDMTKKFLSHKKKQKLQE